MNSWGTILLGYGIVFGGVGLYAYTLVRRGSLLASRLGLGQGSHAADEDLGNPSEDDDARS